MTAQPANLQRYEHEIVGRVVLGSQVAATLFGLPSSRRDRVRCVQWELAVSANPLTTAREVLP